LKLSWYINATESSQPISHIITGLKTKVLNTCCISIIMYDGISSMPDKISVNFVYSDKTVYTKQIAYCHDDTAELTSCRALPVAAE
jgi:hypothetical protein